LPALPIKQTVLFGPARTGGVPEAGNTGPAAVTDLVLSLKFVMR
jgi:hypothetical protein